jgi:formylglycine-generating enzyme required for sulfatase activity
MMFVFINPGEFVMGDSYGDSDERPTHVVRISEGFYMQTSPVTQHQWLKVMPDNPSSFRGDDLPVERVSYEDVMDFIARLNAYGQVSYQLPTEAQWEFACRAGQKTTYYWGEEMQDAYCWYDENSEHRPHPVGEKLPNNWGLYDMLGNVWEWCLDWYDSKYYKRSPHLDPPGPIHGDQRVVRGGSWFGSPFICRSSNRGSYPAGTVKDNLGFRLVIGTRPGGRK